MDTKLWDYSICNFMSLHLLTPYCRVEFMCSHFWTHLQLGLQYCLLFWWRQLEFPGFMVSSYSCMCKSFSKIPSAHDGLAHHFKGKQHSLVYTKPWQVRFHRVIFTWFMSSDRNAGIQWAKLWDPAQSQSKQPCERDCDGMEKLLLLPVFYDS